MLNGWRQMKLASGSHKAKMRPKKTKCVVMIDCWYSLHFHGTLLYHYGREALQVTGRNVREVPTSSPSISQQKGRDPLTRQYPSRSFKCVAAEDERVRLRNLPHPSCSPDLRQLTKLIWCRKGYRKIVNSKRSDFQVYCIKNLYLGKCVDCNGSYLD